MPGIKVPLFRLITGVSETDTSLGICTDIIVGEIILHRTEAPTSSFSKKLGWLPNEDFTLSLCRSYCEISNSLLERHYAYEIEIRCSEGNRDFVGPMHILAGVCIAIQEGQKTGRERKLGIEMISGLVTNFSDQDQFKLHLLLEGGIRMKTRSRPDPCWSRISLPSGLFLTLLNSRSRYEPIKLGAYLEHQEQRLISWIYAGIRNDLDILRSGLSRIHSSELLPEYILDIQIEPNGSLIILSSETNPDLGGLIPDEFLDLRLIGLAHHGLQIV